jgi:uncharacterized membrane protein YfcA
MIDLSTLTATAWVVLVVGALVIGFSKTAIGGLVMVAVALFAAVLPAKPSTGVALLLLIVGDLFAIRAYTKFADWAVLRRLAPFVAVGVVVGAVFLKLAGDVAVKRTIGAILIVLVLVTIVRKLRTPSTQDKAAPSMLLEASAGAGSGFMSMVANAGSLIYLYLLRLGLPMMTFLGTAAWYFFVVNLVKVPISVGLGLITMPTLVLTLVLSPAVAVGAVLGRYVVTRLSMPVFEWAVLVVTLFASLNLVR